MRKRLRIGAVEPVGLLALRRYLPYLRPYTAFVVVFGLAQIGSLAAAGNAPLRKIGCLGNRDGADEKNESGADETCDLGHDFSPAFPR